MSLAAYSREGTWVPLDAAPEVSFRVSDYDRNAEFLCRYFDLMEDESEERQSAKLRAQRKAFLETCIHEARGIGSNGSGVPDLAQWFVDYPHALEELWEKVTARRSRVERAVSDDLGNFRGASPGI